MDNFKEISPVIEFDQVLVQVSKHAVTSMGKSAILEIVPATSSMLVNELNEHTKQAHRLIMQEDLIRLSGELNIDEYLTRVSKSGFLLANELLDIMNFIAVTKQILSYEKSLKINEIDYVRSLLSSFSNYSEVFDEIERSIDMNANIRENANFEIKKLRRSISSKEVEIKNKITRISSANASKLSETLITLRNGRYVLPIKSEFKNSFGGVIHDESATGQTVFIEPTEIIELGNLIVDYQRRLEIEIEKLLRYLSSFIMNRLNDFKRDLKTIVEIDVLLAKARYCMHTNGCFGVINNLKDITYLDAKHPLIFTNVVSNDIVFKEDIMMITGANTGGKTVTLKIIGLFTLMIQSGISVTASSATTCLFNEVFADIGDNQSLEMSLSSFSSHMTNLVEIIEKSTSKSLILFDEIGSGTNPSEGASLAYAIIEYLRNKQCKIVATTHYTELKEYANVNDYVLNASVRFNRIELVPTYKLDLNTSGLSFALDISKSIGLRDEIIRNAEQFLNEHADSNLLLLDKVNEEKLALNEKLKQLEIEKLAFKNQRQLLEIELEQLKDQANKEIMLAKKQANDEIEQAVKQSRDLLTKLATKEKLHEVLADKQAIEKLKLEEQEEFISSNFNFKVGDEVKVLPFESLGEITSKISDDKFEVRMGNINSVIARDKLIYVGEKTKVVSVNTTSVKRNVKPFLDIKGLRYEEAEQVLETYLDNIALANYSKVVIEHGVGTQVLRKLVHQELKKRKMKYRQALQEEGGLNATVIEF